MKRFLCLLLFAFLLLSACGCAAVREYGGTPITNLTYETVEYHGGYTTTYILDFEKNEVRRRGCLPTEDTAEEFTVISTFSEEKEAEFINICYSYGLFGLKDEYKTLTNIVDGGGWTLRLDYEDGSTKTSKGDNAAPDRIFKRCATAFYDLCGIDVLGRVESSYHTPPSLSISFHYSYNNYNFSDNSLCGISRANYKWNKFSASGIDLYSANLDSKNYSNVISGYENELCLYTANYGKNERFIRCEVKSYDFNSELSGEKTVFSKMWFRQEEIPLEPDKIYLVKLTFLDGDFVEYTFNTKASDQKLHFGEYTYNIYNEGHSSLKINEDGSFVLSPFEYFREFIDENNLVIDKNQPSLSGNYTFEEYDGKEYLCLNTDDGKIVFDYCARALFLDFEKTTFDVKKYHLEGNSDYENGGVTFTYNYH